MLKSVKEYVGEKQKEEGRRRRGIQESVKGVCKGKQEKGGRRC